MESSYESLKTHERYKNSVKTYLKEYISITNNN